MYESNEILNPYDTHNWRNVIYENVGEDGEIKLISGYIDVDYLKENPNCNEYIVIDKNLDLSTVNIKDVKYNKYENKPVNRNYKSLQEEEADRE